MPMPNEIVIVAPQQYAVPAGRHAAGVGPPRADRREGEPAGDRNGASAAVKRRAGGTLFRPGRAGAEPAIGVRAPAVRSPRRRNTAGLTPWWLTLAKVSPPTTAVGVVTTGPAPGPRPSSPLPLMPQQYAAPVVVTPQVETASRLTAAKLSPPATRTGVELSERYAAVAAHAPAIDRARGGHTASVRGIPALSVAKVSPPATGTGVVLLAVVPSPSSPA